MCPATPASPLPAVHRVLALPEAGPLTERFGRTALTESVRAILAQARRQLADGAYVDLYPVVREWHETGQSLAVIAERLNAEGHTTRRGRPWNPMQVLRVLRRAG